MSKITLNPIADLTQSTTAQTTINSNLSTVQAAMDNTLSRDGTSPNQMTAAIDMNSNQIFNLPAPSTQNAPARLIDVVSNPTIVVPGTGTSGHTVPFLDGNNTFSGTNIFSGAVTLPATIPTLAGNNTFTGTNTFSTASVRTRLSADTTYFVNSSTGSNSNNGLTSGAPFLTIQFAVNLIGNTLDLNGHNVIIQLADGTYSESVALISYLGRATQGHTGPVVIQGNVSTPANVVVNAGANICFTAIETGGFEWVLSGMTLTSPTGSACALSDAGGWIVIGPSVVFGACPSGNHVLAENGGIVEFVNNYTISGAASSHLFCVNRGQILTGGVSTVTITGTPAFPGSFAFCNRNSLILFNGVTFSGSTTGPRYIVNLGGGIETLGGGANYFPGNSAGTATSPGWYN